MKWYAVKNVRIRCYKICILFFGSVADIAHDPVLTDIITSGCLCILEMPKVWKATDNTVEIIFFDE